MGIERGEVGIIQLVIDDEADIHRDLCAVIIDVDGVAVAAGAEFAIIDRDGVAL